jgi:hypothetical protein
MKKDEWIHVENSSLISGYKYISEKSQMNVEFKNNGAMYAYFDVPGYVADLISDENPGTDIHMRIIKGGYKYKRIN